MELILHHLLVLQMNKLSIRKSEASFSDHTLCACWTSWYLHGVDGVCVHFRVCSWNHRSGSLLPTLWDLFPLNFLLSAFPTFPWGQNLHFQYFHENVVSTKWKPGIEIQLMLGISSCTVMLERGHRSPVAKTLNSWCRGPGFHLWPVN